MGNTDDRLVRRLEAQIAGMQRRLTGDQPRGPHWGGFLGGLALGTLAGAALVLAAMGRREEEPPEALPDRDDAILLREAEQALRERGAALPTAPEDNTAPDQLAAAELEDPGALADIAEQAEAAERAAGEAPEPVEATARPTDDTPDATTGAADEAPEPAARTEQATDEAPGSAASAEASAEAAPPAGSVAPVAGSCPESHPIKGNHSSSGDFIYHVPGGRNYARTNPEVCFATEGDAVAAGYRAPRG